MGVELPVNAVFFLTIFGLIVIVFFLTVTVSKLTTKIKELSQQLGIMQYDLNELKQQKEHHQRD
jgi:predicted Holliday junction resolvase-like endonuclease